VAENVVPYKDLKENIGFLYMDVSIPDNSRNTNYKLYVLDPLSTIIKLAIIGNKPVGTKIYINENIIYLQEPGLFQALCRLYYNTNKTDLQYLYNPIYYACQTYLADKFVDKTPAIKKLFSSAIVGLARLKETYKSCPIIPLCLNLYISVIENHLDEHLVDSLFKKDAMTTHYDATTLSTLNNFWNNDRIKVVLDMIEFLCKDYSASSHVQSLQIFMTTTDTEVCKLLQ
jgi:hypothetical protein